MVTYRAFERLRRRLRHRVEYLHPYRSPQSLVQTPVCEESQFSVGPLTHLSMSQGYLWWRPGTPGYDGWVQLVREEFETEDHAIDAEMQRLRKMGSEQTKKMEARGVDATHLRLDLECGIVYNPPEEGEERIWAIEYFKERMIEFVPDEAELLVRLIEHQQVLWGMDARRRSSHIITVGETSTPIDKSPPGTSSATMPSGASSSPSAGCSGIATLLVTASVPPRSAAPNAISSPPSEARFGPPEWQQLTQSACTTLLPAQRGLSLPLTAAEAGGATEAASVRPMLGSFGGTLPPCAEAFTAAPASGGRRRTHAELLATGIDHRSVDIAMTEGEEGRVGRAQANGGEEEGEPEPLLGAADGAALQPDAYLSSRMEHVGILERAGQWRQASEELAEAMLLCKRHHDSQERESPLGLSLDCPRVV